MATDFTDKKVGDYEVDIGLGKILGEGTWGKVFVGRHASGGKDIAAKLIVWDKDLVTEEMDREAEMMKKIPPHTNVLGIIEYIKRDVWKDSKKNKVQVQGWLILELCTAGNLAEYAEEKGLSVAQKVDLILQGSRGLQHLHQQTPAIIHHDIKLPNLLVTGSDDDPVVKVADFGISKFFAHTRELSVTEKFREGTESYWAPELFRLGENNTSKYNKSVDIFGMGISGLTLLVARCGYSVQTYTVTIEVGKDKMKKGLGRHIYDQNITDVVALIKESGELENVKRFKTILAAMLAPDAQVRLTIHDVVDQLTKLRSDLGLHDRTLTAKPQGKCVSPGQEEISPVPSGDNQEPKKTALFKLDNPRAGLASQTSQIKKPSTPAEAPERGKSDAKTSARKGAKKQAPKATPAPKSGKRAPPTEPQSEKSNAVRRGLNLAAPPMSFHSTSTTLVVHVLVYDITALPVEAIVSAANRRLQHGGGVARAIAKAAGESLTRECDEYIRRYGPLDVTGNMVSNAGKLPCQAVIHAVGPMRDYKNPQDGFRDVHRTFRNVINTATRNYFFSIAIPAISSGIFGVPIEIVAGAMVEVISDLAAKQTTLQEVYLVDITPGVVNMIQQDMARRSEFAALEFSGLQFWEAPQPRAKRETPTDEPDDTLLSDLGLHSRTPTAKPQGKCFSPGREEGSPVPAGDKREQKKAILANMDTLRAGKADDAMSDGTDQRSHRRNETVSDEIPPGLRIPKSARGKSATGKTRPSKSLLQALGKQNPLN